MAHLTTPEGKIELPLYSLKKPDGGFADMFAATSPELAWNHFTELLRTPQDLLEANGFRMVECEFESVPTPLVILGQRIFGAKLVERTLSKPFGQKIENK